MLLVRVANVVIAMTPSQSEAKATDQCVCLVVQFLNLQHMANKVTYCSNL